MRLLSLPQLDLACSCYLSNTVYEVTVMCILGGAGNAYRGVREHFCSAFFNIYVRYMVDIVVCHPESPCETKEHTHQVVEKVG